MSQNADTNPSFADAIMDAPRTTERGSTDAAAGGTTAGGVSYVIASVVRVRPKNGAEIAATECPLKPGNSRRDRQEERVPRKSSRKNEPYADGELEVILSVAPTEANIHWLSVLLKRSENAVTIVYKLAYEHGPFGVDAKVQGRKIVEAKQRIGIKIGRLRPRKA